MRVLFICKRNTTYGFKTYCRRSSGLYNSTSFIVRGLRARGIHAEIIEVTDNNDIDREVTAFRPNLVIVEALWVVPEKFDVLKRLHPKVRWFVHMHSGMPFLALEGIAMDWLFRYAEKEVGIIANSPESFEAFLCILDRRSVFHLQNVYLGHALPAVCHENKDHIDVGCFGAVRPMKNHLLQALAAIRFAREIGKPLRFHVNASRVEVMGDPCLKNLRQLFAHAEDAELVEQHWHEPHEFIELLHHTIDLSMQVSLTETFNVVSADAVTAGVPIVVSKEVAWASGFSKAADNSVTEVVDRMHWVWGKSLLVKWNQHLLRKHSEAAQDCWFEFVRKHAER